MRHDKTNLDQLLKDLDDDMNWDENRQKRLGNKIQSTMDKKEQRYNGWKKSLKYVSSTAGVIALLFLGFQFFSSMPNYNSSDESADMGSPQADHETAEEYAQDTSGDDSGGYDGVDGESNQEEPREETENQSELEQRIIVQQRIGDGQLNVYENINELTHNQSVAKVKDIISETSWEMAEVDMTRPADYRFYYEYENTDKEVKVVMHNVWVTGDQLVIVREPDDYVELTKQISTVLYEALTGESLSNE